MICDRAKGGRYRKAWAMFDGGSITKVLPAPWLLDRTISKQACSLANRASDELLRTHETD
jgi:hypothetical protein